MKVDDGLSWPIASHVCTKFTQHGRILVEEPVKVGHIGNG